MKAVTVNGVSYFDLTEKDIKRVRGIARAFGAPEDAKNEVPCPKHDAEKVLQEHRGGCGLCQNGYDCDIYEILKTQRVAAPCTCA